MAPGDCEGHNGGAYAFRRRQSAGHLGGRLPSKSLLQYGHRPAPAGRSEVAAVRGRARVPRGRLHFAGADLSGVSRFLETSDAGLRPRTRQPSHMAGRNVFETAHGHSDMPSQCGAAAGSIILEKALWLDNFCLEIP